MPKVVLMPTIAQALGALLKSARDRRREGKVSMATSTAPAMEICERAENILPEMQLGSTTLRPLDVRSSVRLRVEYF
jgi:hypothetical protein